MLNQPNRFLASEFVIDESPLDVYEQAHVIVDPAETTESDETDSVMSTANVIDIYQGEDLISEMAKLLMSKHEIALKAKQLEMKGAGDDEFGRFVKHILPFLDNFHHLLDMAREKPPSSELDNWLKNVEALYFRLVNLLDSYGVQFINCVGKPVDLNYQEVIDYRPSNEHKHETVMREVQRAIVFRGRLLREAKVIVACNPNEEA